MLAMKCITRQILYHFYTLFLFTKSDTTLVVIPMVSLLHTAYLPYLTHTLQLTAAMVLAGPTDWFSFATAFVWFELHLLAFDASSQIDCIWLFNISAFS